MATKILALLMFSQFSKWLFSGLLPSMNSYTDVYCMKQENGVPCGCEEGSGILLVPSSLQKPFQQTTVKATGTLGLSPAKPGTCSHLCHLTGTCFQEAGCGQPLVFHNLGKGSSYLASRVTPEDSDRKDPEPKSHQRAQLGFGFSEQRPCSSSASLPMGPKSPTATFLFLGAWHLHSTSPACARCKLLSM